MFVSEEERESEPRFNGKGRTQREEDTADKGRLVFADHAGHPLHPAMLLSHVGPQVPCSQPY